MFRSRMRHRVWMTLVATLVTLGAIASTAYANHIRVMVMTQDYSYTGAAGYVKLRVDFNYSGNCCGGTFIFETGDSYLRQGSFPDLFVSGAYTGPKYNQTGTFTQPTTPVPPVPPPDMKTFTWSSFQPVANVMLVRIEIVFKYDGTGPYTVTWRDCCPASEGAPVVTTAPPADTAAVRIVTFTQAGSTAWTGALEQAGFQRCLATPGPTCYDEILATDLITTPAKLNLYKVMFVGHNADAATITALNAAAADISTWVQNKRGGLVVYAQSNPAGFSWLPNLGGAGVVTAAPSGGNTAFADLTPRGFVHSSHRNQLPGAGAVASTLANWGPSVQHAFTAWPSYFNSAIPGESAALSVDAGGSLLNSRALSLAGIVGQAATPGCAFITGQPVEERALAGVIAAQQMVRSTVGYAVSCSAVKLGIL